MYQAKYANQCEITASLCPFHGEIQENYTTLYKANYNK